MRDMDFQGTVCTRGFVFVLKNKPWLHGVGHNVPIHLYKETSMRLTLGNWCVFLPKLQYTRVAWLRKLKFWVLSGFLEYGFTSMLVCGIFYGKIITSILGHDKSLSQCGECSEFLFIPKLNMSPCDLIVELVICFNLNANNSSLFLFW